MEQAGAMRRDVLKEKWKQCRNELHYIWTQLTADDLDQVNGRRDNLIHLLEHRYGYARRRAEMEVDLFVSEFEERLRRAA